MSLEAEGSDELLVEKLKQGDSKAFDLLVRRYMKKSFAIALNIVNNHEDAEDISQEAFARVYKSIKKFRGDSKFKTWLYRIIINLCRSHIRQKRLFSIVSFGRKQSQDSPERTLEDQIPDGKAENYERSIKRKELRGAMEKAVMSLPHQQREVFILKHFHGLKMVEIAKSLDCAEGTIKVHLHRAVMKLRSALKDFND